MDMLQRTLAENSGELLRELTGRVGFTTAEAELFLEAAGAALVESYQWQAMILPSIQLQSPSAVRDLLSGISGTSLAASVGLTSARTWDGLRALVPAVVRSSSIDAEGMPSSEPRRLEDRGVEQDS